MDGAIAREAGQDDARNRGKAEAKSGREREDGKTKSDEKFVSVQEYCASGFAAERFSFDNKFRRRINREQDLPQVWAGRDVAYTRAVFPHAWAP